MSATDEDGMAEFRAKFGRFPEEGPPQLAPGFQIRRVPAPGWGPVGALLDLARSLFLRRDQLSVPMQEKRDLAGQLAAVTAERNEWRRRALAAEQATAPAPRPQLVVVGCPQCQEPMRDDAAACRVCGWRRREEG